MKKALFILIASCLISGGMAGQTLAESLRVEPGFRDVILRGYSRPLVSSTVAAEVSGVITTRYYDVGDTITNQPLVQIDPTWIDLELQENASAIERTRIAVDQARLRVSWLEKDFKRLQTLVNEGGVSRSTFDEIEQQRDQARLEIRLQEQQFEQLQIQRKTLVEQQKRHRPTAPTGWQVAQRYVDEGELVAAGSPLMDVGDYRHLLIPLSVTAAELSAIREQTQARLNGQDVTYHLHTVSPAFDEKTRKITIELMIDHFTGEQRGGLPFEVAVRMPDEGLMIPVAAISNRYNHPKVKRRDQSQAIEISILNHQGDWVRIAPTTALQPGVELLDQTPDGGSGKP